MKSIIVPILMSALVASSCFGDGSASENNKQKYLDALRGETGDSSEEESVPTTPEPISTTQRRITPTQRLATTTQRSTTTTQRRTTTTQRPTTTTQACNSGEKTIILSYPTTNERLDIEWTDCFGRNASETELTRALRRILFSNICSVKNCLEYSRADTSFTVNETYTDRFNLEVVTANVTISQSGSEIFITISVRYSSRKEELAREYYSIIRDTISLYDYEAQRDLRRYTGTINQVDLNKMLVAGG